MTSDLRKWREFIPLYLAGSLPEDQRQALERALEKYPLLQREFEQFAELEAMYAELKRDAPAPSETAFRRIEASIRKTETRRSTKPLSFCSQRLHAAAAGLFDRPRLAWALVAVQMAIIVLLVAGQKPSPTYRTLSASPRTVEAPAVLQVVFQEQTTEVQIRNVLLGIGATIVAGPNPEGLYTLVLADPSRVREALEKLKQNPVVRFAQKASQSLVPNNQPRMGNN